MNYGPLVVAIDKLVAARIAAFKNSNPDKQFELDQESRRAADQVAIAQDKFYLDVKEGRIESGG